IPNGEIVPLGDDQVGVSDETRGVLEQYLKGAKWAIERFGPVGGEWSSQSWNLHIVTAMPQAQTAGTVLVTTKAPNGKTVTNVRPMTVIDIGGGDLQRSDVHINPYQMTSVRLGDGTIRIARALRERFPRQEWNDVMAQHALMTKRALISGQDRDI